MPKVAKPLTVRQVETVTRAGMIADGNGLYLHIAPTGAKSWIFRYVFGGRRRDMGIGPLSLYKLAEAREIAIDSRRKVRAGVDPLADREERKAEARKAKSFSEVAEAFIMAHENEWRDRGQSWRATMKNHVYPALGHRMIAAIDTAAVVECLDPIWNQKNKTASAARQKIEAILAFAAVRGYRSGENVARWGGHMEHLLAAPSALTKETEEHRAALDWREVPAFMRRLRESKSRVAPALELVILSSCRLSEARLLEWSEVDLTAGEWVVPASKMKDRREHRRPLSSDAIALIERQPRVSELVFPGRAGTAMGKPRFRELLKALGAGHITTHGFRSSFRDWVVERQPSVPSEVAEMALAHQVGTAVSRAYARSDRFEARRALAEAWSDYCANGETDAKIVPLPKRA